MAKRVNFTPVIKECEIFGEHYTCEEFVSRIKESDGEKLLKDIYDYYGYKSIEFMFALQGFIFWLINKHVWEDKISKVSEEELQDLLSQCITMVLERLEHTPYEPSLGKLSSYIYTAIRGEVTKFMYRVTHGEILEGFDNNLGFIEELDEVAQVRAEVFDKLFSMYGLEKVEACNYRKLLWEKMKEHFGGQKQMFEVKEEDGYLVIKQINRDVMLLLMFSALLKLDLRVLLYLYEKYGEDLWFFFFMLGGKKLSFPKHSVMYKVFKFVDFVLGGKKIGAKTLMKSKKLLDVYKKIFGVFSAGGEVRIHLSDPLFFGLELSGDFED